MQEQVRQLIHTDLQCIDNPIAFSQFVRGELYFYTDSMLTLIHALKEEDFLEIYDFMGDFF